MIKDLNSYNEAIQDIFVFDSPMIDLILHRGKKPPKYAREPIQKKYSVNRNDQCPCGSGKKFKKCCIDEPA